MEHLMGQVNKTDPEEWKGLGKCSVCLHSVSFLPSCCKQEPTLRSSGLSKLKDRWKDHFQNKGGR